MKNKIKSTSKKRQQENGHGLASRQFSLNNHGWYFL